MNKSQIFNPLLASVLLLAPLACATVSGPSLVPVAPPPSARSQPSPLPARWLKRKVAVARFSNESRYGRALLMDGDLDPLGKQATDMMYNRLIQSGHFLVIERPDLEKVKREQGLAGPGNLVGVDTLIVGSVTEFGRSTTGKVGFLSATKNQTARAKVEIRLVDARTGQAFHTATGTGEASTESGHVAGYGSAADYDATLNDRAIGAAISDVMNSLVTTLDERPWRSDVLKVEGDRAIIAGGAKQGLRVGDRLDVVREGEKLRSRQSGFEVGLPAERVATVQVLSLFGDRETDEGAICERVEGTLPSGIPLFVTEVKP